MYWLEVCPCPRSAQDFGTPLSLACSQGHIDVIQTLLSAGANKEAVDKVGMALLLCYSFSIVRTHVLV